MAPSAYQSVASVSLCNSTAGSFYHIGTTTYLHALDGRDLTIHGDELVLIQPVSNSVITWAGSYKLYFSGIDSWGGAGNGVKLVSNGNQYLGSSFYARDCKFNAVSGGASNGLSVGDIAVCISERVECSANRRDGFNYHIGTLYGKTTLAPHFVEVDCSAHGNGLLGAEGNNQGSTAHEDCVGLRINSDYSGHPDGGCVVDIEGVKCYLISCSANNSGVAGLYLAADGYNRGSGVKPAEWWIDGAVCKNNPTVGDGSGDVALNGYYTIMHFRDTDTEKPLSTRTFSNFIQSPDSDFS